ncbi:hypothetical protein D8M04_07735 [Oceanobacillus piezotolerans]|uniref:Cell-wall binding lipoprotein n=1 Tax=Oceanobacillus piezotolerans TaxID=2448030 RepID=A0A498DRJ2_9BACI|nr:YkyA family protein [Oceanobacillus piezotolerans]RLL47069.1 hypothetical protein D8M04_07735 [Oceanobacillus piezotolerans]
MDRLIVIVTSFLGLFLLGGCANQVENAMAVTESVHTTGNGLVDELNSIVKQESELQDSFEQTLAEDKELKSLADGSSTVFANIEARKESLNRIEEYRNQLEENYTAFTDNDTSDLPEEDVGALTESLDQLTSSISDYMSHYADALREQEEFFKSLAEDNATYKTMTEGIESIASNDEKTSEFLLQLDEQLAALQNDYESLQVALNEKANAS